MPTETQLNFAVTLAFVGAAGKTKIVSEFGRLRPDMGGQSLCAEGTQKKRDQKEKFYHSFIGKRMAPERKV
jgi:hypothetical protein